MKSRPKRLGATGKVCWLSVVRGLRWRAPASTQPLRPHEPGDPFAAAADALVAQERVHPRTAIDAASGDKGVLNLTCSGPRRPADADWDARPRQA